MLPPRRRQQSYDHRLREVVRRSGDVEIATQVGVPRSTAAGWLRARPRAVVTLDILDGGSSDLRDEVLRLRRRVRVLGAVVGLLVAQRKDYAMTTGAQGRRSEIPRARLLAAVRRARKILPLRSALRVLGVSSSAYHSWTVEPKRCGLEPERVCPRSRPDRLTTAEVRAIHSMATDEQFRHVPTGRLAVLAERLGRVHASTTTWYRLVRSRGWERSRHRRHPATPRVGIRATAPDQVWHIDTSVVRLVDGTKVWIHAVIDNFSRRVVSWWVSERLEISNAVAVLSDAVDGAGRAPQFLRSGGGVTVGVITVPYGVGKTSARPRNSERKSFTLSAAVRGDVSVNRSESGDAADVGAKTAASSPRRGSSLAWDCWRVPSISSSRACSPARSRRMSSRERVNLPLGLPSQSRALFRTRPPRSRTRLADSSRILRQFLDSTPVARLSLP